MSDPNRTGISPRCVKGVLHEIKNPLHGKGNHQQSKTAYMAGDSYTSDRRLYLEYNPEKTVQNILPIRT